MKKMIFPIVSLFILMIQTSCTSPQLSRDPSSVESMAATSMAVDEIQKNSSSQYFAENKYFAIYRFSLFIATANDNKLPLSEKKNKLNADIEYARTQLDQCGYWTDKATDCKKITEPFNKALNMTTADVAKNDFKSAALRANSVLSTIIKNF